MVAISPLDENSPKDKMVHKVLPSVLRHSSCAREENPEDVKVSLASLASEAVATRRAVSPTVPPVWEDLAAGVYLNASV
jgi:hypothetical protein